jgi:hypothetical protein
VVRTEIEKDIVDGDRGMETENDRGMKIEMVVASNQFHYWL